MPKLYIGRFTNSQVLYADNSDFGQEVIVKIIDVTDASDEEIEIELAENPVTIRVIDNSEDKFTPIRSKACELRLHTSPNIDIMTFGGGGDNQYKVQIRMDSSDLDVFEGWLSISDLRQDFQPDPNVLVLTATDGLGFLKDVPLTDYYGNQFRGVHKLSTYIAGCLRKTGLDKSFIAEMNVKESTQATNYLGHMYNTIYLDARTFMSSIDEYEDCFTVLEKILGEYCELSQQKNEWYIRAIDEFDAQDSIQIRFNSAGEIQSQFPIVAYDKLIGSNMNLYQMGFMNDDASMSLQRPYKYVRHFYNFETPIENVCNINFERGDFITNLPDETINGITYNAKSYKIDCWKLTKGDPTTFDEYPSGDLYIKRLFDEYGREFSRYAVVKYPTVASEKQNVISEGIDVTIGDKFELSWDFAFSAQTGVGLSPMEVGAVLLEGDDGSYWFLGDTGVNSSTSFNFPADDSDVMAWYQSNANWSTNYKYFTINTDFGGFENTEFQTITINKVEPLPVSGKLYIMFIYGNRSQFSPDSLYLSNLNFDYKGKINGTYEIYTGLENKIEQAGDFKAKRDVEVFLSDGPNIAFKGCLKKRIGDIYLIGGAQKTITFYNGNYFTLPGYYTWLFEKGMILLISGTTNNNSNNAVVTNVAYSIIGNVTTVTLSITTVAEVDSSYAISTLRYGLTEGFYNGAVFPSGPPGPDYIKPYGQIQTEAVWNQFNRVFTAFEGTIDGLDTYVKDGEDRIDIPDLMHSFFIMDAHPGTNNKKFKLLHMDQNYDLCEWGLFLVEVYDSTIPKVYTGHSFKYLQND